MSYYVLYTEKCSPKILRFEKKTEALKFIGNFTLKHLTNRDDNWIDSFIFGKIIASEVVPNE